MQEEQFKTWLNKHTSLKDGPKRDAVCRCRRVVKGLSVNLDEEYEKDKCCKLLEQLEYSDTDRQQKKPLPGKIVIKGDYVKVMSGLRSAVRKYCEFKEQVVTQNTGMTENKTQNTDMPANKTWLVYAKRQHCAHEQAIRDLGFINWTQNKVDMHIGDVVYIFFNTDPQGRITRNGSVKFKAKVTAKDFPRQRGDAKYWTKKTKNKTLNELTYVLTIEKEYVGNELTEEKLRKYGFPENRIECEVYKKTKLINYITLNFFKKCKPFVKKKQVSSTTVPTQLPDAAQTVAAKKQKKQRTNMRGTNVSCSKTPREGNCCWFTIVDKKLYSDSLRGVWLFYMDFDNQKLYFSADVTKLRDKFAGLKPMDGYDSPKEPRHDFCLNYFDGKIYPSKSCTKGKEWFQAMRLTKEEFDRLLVYIQSHTS